jgi:TetR/AcrR family tetracycline transcriptional repressor
MARPRTPLISRQAAVAAALEIIDTEGLEAFSLPRLARHKGVRAPSREHQLNEN